MVHVSSCIHSLCFSPSFKHFFLPSFHLSHAGLGFDRNRIPFSHTGDVISFESRSCIYYFIFQFFLLSLLIFYPSLMNPQPGITILISIVSCDSFLYFLLSSRSLTIPHHPSPLVPLLSKRLAPLAVACFTRWAGIRWIHTPSPSLGLRVHSNPSSASRIFILWSSFRTSILNINMLYPFIQLPLSIIHCSTSCHHLSSKSFTQFIVFFQPSGNIG